MVGYLANDLFSGWEALSLEWHGIALLVSCLSDLSLDLILNEDLMMDGWYLVNGSGCEDYWCILIGLILFYMCGFVLWVLDLVWLGIGLGLD